MSSWLSFLFAVVLAQSPAPAMIINELSYDPKIGVNCAAAKKDDCQWIELKNSGSSGVTLVGGTKKESWRICDRGEDERHCHTFKGSVEIPPGGFVVLADNPEEFRRAYPGFTGILLDATLDLLKTKEATLALSDGVFIEGKRRLFAHTTYAPELGADGNGHTLERKSDGQFRESEALGGTPGVENSQGTPKREGKKLAEQKTSETEPSEEEEAAAEEEEEIPRLSIGEARKLGRAKLVEVEGILTVPFGKLGRSIGYLQDESAGIALVFSEGEPPDLTPGTRLRLTGKTADRRGERRLRIFEAGAIVHLGEGVRPQPKKLKASEVSEEVEGEVVELSGTIEEPRGRRFFLRDETGRVKVILRRETGIKVSLRSGAAVRIQGVVSQDGEEYRVLPWEPERVEIEVAKEAGEETAQKKKRDSEAKRASKLSGEGDEEGLVLGREEARMGRKPLAYVLALAIPTLGLVSYLLYDHLHLAKRGRNS